MNKKAGHYQAVCPYCNEVLRFDVLEDGKKRMVRQCKHFYCFRGDQDVCFCTTQDVQAEKVVYWHEPN